MNPTFRKNDMEDSAIKSIIARICGNSRILLEYTAWFIVCITISLFFLENLSQVTCS